MDSGSYAEYPNRPIKEIDFGVISEGFNLITKNLPPFLLTGLIIALVYWGVTVLEMATTLAVFGIANPDTTDMSAILGDSLRRQALAFPFSLLTVALISPFALSMTMMTLKTVRGQAVSVSDIASGWSRAGQAIVAGLAVFIAVQIGTMLCCLPGLILNGLFMFSFPLIADKALGPFEAMGESWRNLVPHLWMALLFHFVVSLLAGLGILACGVGVILTIPIYCVCPALVYRDFTMGKPRPG